MSNKLHVVILAAGQGTRMKSELPKVLHSIGGKPMVEHVINNAQVLNAAQIHLVYGHGAEQVQQQMGHYELNWVLQAEQLGTGHAVQQAVPHLEDDATVLILYGDVPLTSLNTLKKLIQAAEHNFLAVLTAIMDNPTGYGRIVRDAQGHVQCIVEQKDANDEQLKIREINTGMMALNGGRLKQFLSQLQNNNAQGEYYLTDIIAMAVEQGVKINTVHPDNLFEIDGVNNKFQLATLERQFQKVQAQQLMTDGLTLLDPERFDLRGKLSIGKDVVIDVNVVIEGNVTLGDGVHIGPNCLLQNCSLGVGTQVLANSIVEDSSTGANCVIGPFARLRPGTNLADQVKIGNFVEVKKSNIADNSKVNHLSYIGDSEVGKDVNVGAGTITCNYDGANKHKTVIGDGAFIGSDTQLVAPVEVGAGATIGAGSTISHDAPPGELTLSRSQQKTRKGWKRPVKNK